MKVKPEEYMKEDEVIVLARAILGDNPTALFKL